MDSPQRKAVGRETRRRSFLQTSEGKIMVSRDFTIRSDQSLADAARKLDAELSARPLEPFTPQEVSALRAFDWALNRIEDASKRKGKDHV